MAGPVTTQFGRIAWTPGLEHEVRSGFDDERILRAIIRTTADLDLDDQPPTERREGGLFFGGCRGLVLGGREFALGVQWMIGRNLFVDVNVLPGFELHGARRGGLAAFRLPVDPFADQANAKEIDLQA